MPLDSSFLSSKTSRPASTLLKVLGVVLSLTSMFFALMGIFFWQNVPNLIFAVLVGIFGSRVLALWLGTNRPSSVSKQSVPPRYPAPFLHQEQKPMVLSNPPSPFQSTHPAQLFYASQSLDGSVPEDPLLPLYMPEAVSSSPFTNTLHLSSVLESSLPREGERQMQEQEASSLSIPINEDPIFQLDRPVAGEQCFILPKEGEPLVECQDSYALHAEHRCYAVADGVAGSFVPGPWARIIASSFVQRAGEFVNRDDFQNWLLDCCRQWHAWIENRWVPTMNSLRERNGDSRGEWSDDIRQGAQTTLIGCSLLPDPGLEDKATTIRVFAIGDGEFFLFRPDVQGGWHMVEAFPYSDPHEFGSRPNTLITVPRADLLDRSWMQRKTMQISAFSGDRIVLASDTLAKWLLTQTQQNNDSWVSLLTNTTSTEFEQRMRHEAYCGRIEDDDLTMLIIPVS